MTFTGNTETNMETEIFDGNALLRSAREYLRDNWLKGVDCPCCHQFVKRYRRPMHSSQAAGLIALYRASNKGETYCHIHEFVNYLGSGDFAKLRFWGLVEEEPKDKNDKAKKTSGRWKLTEKGCMFVRAEIGVQSHVTIFNKKCYGLQGKQVTIGQVLGKKFDYSELMGN